MQDLIFLYEWYERRSLNLDRLPRAVVEGDHEVEEIRFPEIWRRLLLEVGPADAWRNAEPKIPEIG